MRVLLPCLAVLLATPALADDCQPVLDAQLKLASTPNVQTITGSNPGVAVTTADTQYLQVGGNWIKHPYDSAAAISDMKQTLSQQHLTCTAGADDAVGGEKAATYTVHVKTDEGDQSDAQYWISRSRGLPLKQVFSIEGSDLTVTISYDNVKAPM